MEEAGEVVAFWAAAGREKWFATDPAFDAAFASRFLGLHEEAAAGALGHWAEEATGALALLLLLDQFPRNVFRGTPRAFASDAQALTVADRALARGHDQQVEKQLRVFFYLPYEHSERLFDQERALVLIGPLGGEVLRFAELHVALIRRFGRFPHRNAILGRVSSAEEEAYLADGGFRG